MQTGSVFLLGLPRNETNRRLLRAWARLGIEVALVPVGAARTLMRPEDVAIGRLDVLATLDGVEPGLFQLHLLERSGSRVLNGARALLACHDKWRTAQLLERAGVPHPTTTLAKPGRPIAFGAPLVIKPRFGSWGADVEHCATPGEVIGCLERAKRKSWYRRHGALLQEVVPSTGVDLRVVVAGGRPVGAIARVALQGEWRTNTSLGARRVEVDPSKEARALAVAAAAAVGADLVGVDLLPLPGGGYCVIELNGAVDFNEEYGIDGGDAYEDAAAALGLLGVDTVSRARAGRASIRPEAA